MSISSDFVLFNANLVFHQRCVNLKSELYSLDSTEQVLKDTKSATVQS